MMSKNSPQLRFEGFTDDWEERKFSDFTKLSQGLQIAISDRFTEAGPNKEFYITNEFLNPNNTKKYYIENPSKNVIANKNDILMTRTGNTGKVVTNTKGAFHNNFFKIDYDPQTISKLFLYFLLTSIPIQKEILIRAGTSTIPDLNHKDFYNIKVYLPIFEEQQRIGSFFKQLDDTIALHQRKLDLLKEQKKGYLQKMFPKNGEKVPELRFEGFADDWEERKLGDEVRIVMGQSPNSENYTDDPNDYILVQGNADMKNGRVFPRVWTTQITKQAKKDDLILSVRAPVGDIGKTAYDVVIGRGVAAIKGNEFIFQNLGKMKSDGYWTRYSTGSTFESINSTDIKEAIISVPAIEEQNKIGSFFKQLDNTIALHQLKLDLLKEQKKGFLQKMFA